VYQHNDPDHLEHLLRQAPVCRRRLIVSDAVFSMDGDLAHLPGLLELSERYDTLLILDEAHATGVLGATGRGLLEYYVDQGELEAGRDGIDLAMGTFSKALGSFGGFVACASRLRELLINKARSFIFSTALPPAAVGAARASLQLIQQDSSPLQSLRKNCSLLRNELAAGGFELRRSEGPIIPLLLGPEAKALRVSESLLANGYFVPAIRPPSVPPGTCRLRITVTATHSGGQIKELSRNLIELAEREGHPVCRSHKSAAG
jgi:7-keto-8-aminopelargonate synthetase-like enzyme